VAEGKVSLIAGVNQRPTRRIKAGDLVNCVAEKVVGAVVVGRIWPRPVALQPEKSGCRTGGCWPIG